MSGGAPPWAGGDCGRGEQERRHGERCRFRRDSAARGVRRVRTEGRRYRVGLPGIDGPSFGLRPESSPAAGSGASAVVVRAAGEGRAALSGHGSRQIAERVGAPRLGITERLAVQIMSAARAARAPLTGRRRIGYRCASSAAMAARSGSGCARCGAHPRPRQWWPGTWRRFRLARPVRPRRSRASSCHASPALDMPLKGANYCKRTGLVHRRCVR
jgi:hypothetical protein